MKLKKLKLFISKRLQLLANFHVNNENHFHPLLQSQKLGLLFTLCLHNQVGAMKGKKGSGIS